MRSVVKLDAGQKHILKLIEKGQNCPNGWAPVSKAVLPLILAMPDGLIESCQFGMGNELQWRARLTREGESLVNAMAWL